MVKMLSNLFNKRKREIERLNNIINNMQGDIKQISIAFYNINARKIELEQELTVVNKSILDLTHEVKYLKMQINTTNDQTNSKSY
jgi:predicted  nucleic acid-binding Zn-ribbon protein